MGQTVTNPLPPAAGPFTVVLPAGPPVLVTWTRIDARTYPVRSRAGQYMGAAIYEPDYRHPKGSEPCLICNCASGRVPEAVRSLLNAASLALVAERLTWPLWRGLLTMDGAERPRGAAGLLRLLAADLFPTTDLYVPAYFGRGGPPPS